MRIDITRQPLSFVMTQFMLFSMLFLCRVELFPALAETVNVSSGFALGGMVDGWMVKLGAWGRLVTLAVVFVNAILITRVVTRNMVLGTRTYIPSLIYLMLSAGLFVGVEISGYLVAMLVIHGSYYLIRGFRRVFSFDFLFRGGLFFGLAVLFDFEALFFIAAIIVALILFRRTMREAIAAVVGFALPLAVYSYVYWGMGYSFTHVCLWGWTSMDWMQHYGHFVSTIGVLQLVFVSVLILIVFLSLGAFLVNIRNMRNRASRVFTYFIWLLLFSLVVFVVPFSSTMGYAVIAVPVAVIAPYYFVRHSNRVSTMLYSILLISIIAANIIPFFV